MIKKVKKTFFNSFVYKSKNNLGNLKGFRRGFTRNRPFYLY